MHESKLNPALRELKGVKESIDAEWQGLFDRPLDSIPPDYPRYLLEAHQAVEDAVSALAKLVDEPVPSWVRVILGPHLDQHLTGNNFNDVPGHVLKYVQQEITPTLGGAPQAILDDNDLLEIPEVRWYGYINQDDRPVITGFYADHLGEEDKHRLYKLFNPKGSYGHCVNYFEIKNHVNKGGGWYIRADWT